MVLIELETNWLPATSFYWVRLDVVGTLHAMKQPISEFHKIYNLLCLKNFLNFNINYKK